MKIISCHFITFNMLSKPLPDVQHFVSVEPSKEKIDFAKYDDGSKARKGLTEEFRIAMTTQELEISRQVDIGHTILQRTPQEEEERLQAPAVEKGSYHGFKPHDHWRNKENGSDKVENFNIYRDMTLQE